MSLKKILRLFSRRYISFKIIGLLGIFICPVQAQNSAVRPQFPYVGACLSTQPRLMQVPGRVFDNFQGQPVDAANFLDVNGFNAVRVVVNYSQPLQTGIVDNQDIDHREANYLLDFGGIDWQVAVAKQARALGQKVILTLHFGQDKPIGSDNWHEFIPDDWLGLTYRQTLAKIDSGTRRMLHPFFAAGVQPDILITENESDSGMLFQTLHGQMELRDNKTTNPFSDAATGIYCIWPKCAGYFKQEILSVKAALRQAGFDPAKTRIAVHGSTTPGHSRFLFQEIFDNKPDAESVYYENGAPKGVLTAVPAFLRKLRLCDMVDIMGFSFYPEPPKNNSSAAFADSLRQLTADLAYFSAVIPRYGRFTQGPWQGQFRKQALMVEFSVPTEAAVGFDIARQQQFVSALFDKLAGYTWTLGALWWEPTYARNNWLHDEGSLYRRVRWDAKRSSWSEFKPIDTLRTWGSFAAGQSIDRKENAKRFK